MPFGPIDMIFPPREIRRQPSRVPATEGRDVTARDVEGRDVEGRDVEGRDVVARPMAADQVADDSRD